MNFTNIPLCILQNICDKYLNFIDVKNLKQINKKCNRIQIRHFDGLNFILLNLTNETLKKYPHLTNKYFFDKNDILHVQNSDNEILSIIWKQRESKSDQDSDVLKMYSSMIDFYSE